MKIDKNQITVIAFSGILLLSFIPMLFIQEAYAVAGFQSYVKTDLSTGSNNACTAITVLPSTQYVIQSCDNASTTTTFYTSFYSGTQITAKSVTTTTGHADRNHCWAVTSVTAVCQQLYSSGENHLRRITVTGATTTSETFLSLGSVTAGQFQQFGGNIYASTVTNGNFYRISLSSFTQTGLWTGLETGTCSNVDVATAIDTNKGIAICDTNEIKLFSFNGGAGSGVITYLDSASIPIAVESSNGITLVYDGTSKVYVVNNGKPVTFISISLSSNTFTDTAGSYPISASDMKGVAGGYWLLLGTDNQVYLLQKQIAPPNNLVVVQPVPFNYGGESRLASANSETFVISKGDNGNTTLFFIKATNLHNESDQPVFEGSPIVGIGGVDCSLPENTNILICRVGGTGAMGSAGAFVIGNASAGTGLMGIGCSIGIVDCIQNTDPKENGLGILMFIASIFIVVGMFVTTQGMENTIKLPLHMWAIIIIGLSAFFTLTNIIDPVFLIVSIIGLIALGAPKLVNTLKGGNTFGSGSTE